jgi:hypothetical protein
MPSDVTHIHFCSLRYHFNSCIGGCTQVRPVELGRCMVSVCVVSILSSRLTASALVWFSYFLKYLVFHFFISLSTVFIWGSSLILWLFMYRGAFRMDRRALD